MPEDLLARPAALWIRPESREALAEAGFRETLDFLRGGRLIRRRGGKENVEAEIHGPEGRQRVFLKRFGPARRPPGRKEFENHRAVEALGIPVPELLAAGWCPEGSFTATAEVPGGARPLDDVLTEAFAFPLASERARAKRRLLAAAARIARTLHGAGWCHRDLYLCHFFAHPDDPEAMRLIDLQRVRAARPFRTRWVVKDLAALNHSARPCFASAADRVRFLKAYLGLRRLDGAARGLVRRVLRKTRAIAKHAERHRR